MRIIQGILAATLALASASSMALAQKQALPLGLQRMSESMNALERDLATPSVDVFVDQVLAQRSTRHRAFEIEALLRLYKDWKGFNEEAVKVELADVKDLEDVLGGYIDVKNGLGFLAAAQAPQPVIAHFTGVLHAQKATVAGFLVRKGWYAPGGRPGPRVQALKARMLSWKWPDAGRDQEYVTKELAQYIEKVQEKPYDFRDLENGVHEYRRNLRWIGLYIKGLKGAVLGVKRLTGDPRLDRFLNDAASVKLDDSYYPAQAAVPVLRPALISKPLSVALTWAVFQLGLIKDDAATRNALVEGFVRGRLAPNPAAADLQVARLLGNSPVNQPFGPKALSVRAVVESTQLLKRLRHEISGKK